MSSNLIILPPDYMIRADKHSMPTGATNYSEKNVVAGSRQMRFRSSASVDFVHFEVNSSNLPEAERQANFAYIAGLRLVTDRASSSIDVGLYGSDDAFSTTKTSKEVIGLTSGDMQGVNGEDYVVVDDNLLPSNYWRLRVDNTPSSAIIYELRKVFFGRYFDMGRDPEVPLDMRIEDLKNKRQGKRVIVMRWRNITNAKVKELEDRVLKYGNFPFALYTRNYLAPLNGERVFYCRIQGRPEITSTLYDKNNVTLEFREEI